MNTGPLFPYGPFCRIKDGNPVARALYERHYSCRPDRPEGTKLFVRPGGKLLLLTHCQRALVVWSRQNYSKDGQTGINCAVFRNEGAGRSSDLLLAAEQVAWLRWPGQRLFTYVDPAQVSDNPGYCFLCAGWRRCGRTAKGFHILEKLPLTNDLDFPTTARTPATAARPKG